MTRPRFPLALGALICALAACSPTTPPADEGAADSASAPATNAPAESSSPGGDPGDDGRTERGEEGRAEFRQGLEDLVVAVVPREDLTAAGLTEDEIDSYFACITNATYDELSEETVRAIQGGDGTAQIPEADRTRVLSAVSQCAQAPAEP
ncbi:MAG: hypothetical protein Q4P33_00695 [Flaviflexus sp.]|nr:hypothetical protein [Flaviflexus sp.]